MEHGSIQHMVKPVMHATNKTTSPKFVIQIQIDTTQKINT